MYSHPHAACNLVTTLIDKGFTLKPEFFAPKYGSFTSKVAIKEMPGVLIETTEFYARLADFMDLDTDGWLIALSEEPIEYDWHYIVITEGADIEVDEFVVIARSRTIALGYLIEKMAESHSKPTELKIGGAGEICLYANEQKIAFIAKINFESVTGEYVMRATTALKGLERYQDYDMMAKPLSKLPGFPKADKSPSARSNILRPQPLLHHTCKNMVICVERALAPVVDEKIPNHLLQELTATICGFESWNHFTGAAKKHEETLFFPYAVTHANEWTIQVEKGISFYKGLAPGLVGFGKALLSQPRNLLTEESNFSGGLMLTNRTPTRRTESSTQPYMEPEGIVLNKPYEVFCEENSKELAAMVMTADNASELLREYFFVDLDNKNRLFEFNKRYGVKPDDQVFIGDWVYWVKRGDTERNGYFAAERLSKFGQAPWRPVTSSLHKASFVRDDEGEFWLATDWDRKPKHKLPELTKIDARRLEKKFFAKENWRNVQIDD